MKEGDLSSGFSKGAFLLKKNQLKSDGLRSGKGREKASDLTRGDVVRGVEKKDRSSSSREKVLQVYTKKVGEEKKRRLREEKSADILLWGERTSLRGGGGTGLRKRNETGTSEKATFLPSTKGRENTDLGGWKNRWRGKEGV